MRQKCEQISWSSYSLAGNAEILFIFSQHFATNYISIVHLAVVIDIDYIY